MESTQKPLHLCHVHKISIIINRSYTLLYSIAIALLIYYRLSFLLQETKTPILPWLLVFTAELLLSVIWLLGQAYRWRPVSRTVFPERLPEDDKLLAIDVFICTADPDKEPTVDVMNTVLSAMSLDYPPEKLNVYLSDDGGSHMTLVGVREAYKFARFWVLFCRKYGVKKICPEAYFFGIEDDYGIIGSTEFLEERQIVKEKYDEFKERLIRAKERVLSGTNENASQHDHPSVIEVIQEDNCNESVQECQAKMPLLVYVSREKKPSHPHNFKAGALNVLLRVSGMISNSPILLVLDCDMYCNGPSSARQAMCFHMDPNISTSLAYVLFPQRFHNLSNNDIYDSQIRTVFALCWPGYDGLKGPCLSGTNYYIKRKSLYDNDIQKGVELEDLKSSFGSSNDFIKSIRQNQKTRIIDAQILQEAKVLASCAYENGTRWGKQVGFLYHSVLEDYFTSFILHCRGWTSVYLNPSRAQFLGASTTTLNDLLIQSTRWSSGLVRVGVSRFCPILYGTLRMSILESMCYAQLAFEPLLYSLSLWCLALVLPLCLLFGIQLYPEVSNSFFSVFMLIFLSSLFKHLQEVLSTGGSIQIWRNEQRIWMMKSISSHFYGSLDAIMQNLGMREASFLPTNKVIDDEQFKRYEMGIFDFQTSPTLLVPLVIPVILNMMSFVFGILRVIFVGDLDKLFAQVFLSFYALITNYAIIEGMVARKDKGRIASSVTLLSAMLSVIFVFAGSIFLMLC